MLGRSLRNASSLNAEWSALASKALKGKDPAGLIWKTPEGIPILPVRSPLLSQSSPYQPHDCSCTGRRAVRCPGSSPTLAAPIPPCTRSAPGPSGILPSTQGKRAETGRGWVQAVRGV